MEISYHGYFRIAYVTCSMTTTIWGIDLDETKVHQKLLAFVHS